MTDPSLASPLTRQERAFTLIGALLGLLLAALDQTIVSTAGPAIQADLAIEPALYAWITTSYLVASTLMVPIYGKLSDLFGRRSILLTGIGIFLVGSLLCGVSQSTWQLIAARAVQGLGSAALFTSAFAVVADVFPPAERGKYQGIFGAVFGLSSVVGPLIGGFITDHFGWHWVFLVNLPVGALAVSFIVSKMPALRPHQARRPRIDYLGAFFLAVFVVPLLLALSLGRSDGSPDPTGWGWGSWQILSMFAAAAVGALLFVLVEGRTAEPILDLRLFGSRGFAFGNAAAFIAGAGFLAAIVFLPLFMVNVVGLSATSSGLTITPLTFGIVAGNIISGQVVSRVGHLKRLLLGALVVLTIAYAVMGFTLSADSTQGEVTLKMILIGLGLGPTIPLYTLAIQNSVDPRQIGVATSSATFFRQMGSTIGIALLGTVFANTLGGEIQARVSSATAGAPPQLRQQFEARPAGGGAGGEGGRANGLFPREELRARIQATMSEQRRLVEAALRGDRVAAEKVLASPGLPPELRKTLEGPPIATRVQAGLEPVRARVLEGIASGSQSDIAALARDPEVPELVRQCLLEVIPGDTATPEARLQLAMRATEGLDAVSERAVRQAVDGAVAGAVAGLNEAEEQALSTVDRVARAFKEAFTEAIKQIYRWGILIGLLAFLVTLRLPEIPLRRTLDAPPAAAD
jgi:EmrB/QacA subfamily drug resistance transporter